MMTKFGRNLCSTRKWRQKCSPLQVKSDFLEIPWIGVQDEKIEIPQRLSQQSPLETILENNHNYNKIVKSDWLSAALISALIGQFNRTVRVMPK